MVLCNDSYLKHLSTLVYEIKYCKTIWNMEFGSILGDTVKFCWDESFFPQHIHNGHPIASP